MLHCDVLVVGAGAMGNATAWQLARRGLDVVVLEQFEQGHQRGSSHGTSRIFRISHAEPEYLQLARNALVLWRGLEQESQTSLLTITGGVHHGALSPLENIEAALNAYDIYVERLSPAEAKDRFPGMHFAGPVLYQPEEGRIDAKKTIETLTALATQQGTQFHFNQRVEKIVLKDENLATVHTADG